MPLAAVPPDYHLNRPEVIAFGGYQTVKYRGGLLHPFDVTRRCVSAIRFGQTTYHLRQPSQGSFYPSQSAAEGEFAVEGFSHAIVGRGGSPDEAYQDWVKQFHSAFQRLYVMRPFEMDDGDRRLWGAMESLVEVDQYRAGQPLVVLQQGKVLQARPYPDVVLWEDGTKERIPLARMPGEFAGYKVGQPFEAVVHRDPVSHKIFKVEYVKRLPARAKNTAAESKQLWDSLPTSKSLPDSDWD